jgi:hypothetical protein
VATKMMSAAETCEPTVQLPPELTH